MEKQIRRFIPNFLKPPLKKAYYFLLDVKDRLNGKDNMIPPRTKSFVGAGDFEGIGEEFKNHFIALANLQPSDRVLDVGCGIGRMAIPLTNYLSEKGEYWGFDIVKEGIDWCQSRVSPRFSNFYFQHSDVYNKHYNPMGKIQARDFHFPFDDEYFDFVFLTSVFTHMLPADLENYLSEISRVLKPGGKTLITFFLLNEESETLIHEGSSTLDFSYEIQGCKTIDENDPEISVAYSEETTLRLYRKYGLKIAEPVHYGAWCNRETFLTYQDLIVATKTPV